MGAKTNKPGTLRYRMEQAQRLRDPEQRAREIAALNAEKQELVLSVYEWVWKKVNAFYKRYQLRPHDRDDVAQAAFERVLMGAETYDPAKARPTTYFGYVAWDGMQKWFATRNMIRVPQSSAKAGSAVLREHAERVRNGTILSLSWDYEDNSQPDAWQVDEPEERPYECDEIESLRDALRHLRKREREILLDRMAGRTMQAIGDDYGISKERVRQIQLEGIEKLRRRLGSVA